MSDQGRLKASLRRNRHNHGRRRPIEFLHTERIPAMTKTKTTTASASKRGDNLSELLKQYGCGPVEFTGTPNALYERHLVFDHVIPEAATGPRERLEAVARSVRDVLSQ